MLLSVLPILVAATKEDVTLVAVGIVSEELVPAPIALLASACDAAVITPRYGADIADAPPTSALFLPSIKLFAPLAPISCSLAKVTALFAILAVATEVKYEPAACAPKSDNISDALLAVKLTTPEPLVVILRYFTKSLPSISKCCATEALVILALGTLAHVTATLKSFDSVKEVRYVLVSKLVLNVPSLAAANFRKPLLLLLGVVVATIFSPIVVTSSSISK